MAHKWIQYTPSGLRHGKSYTEEEINAFPTRQNASAEVHNGWYITRVDETTIHAESIIYPNAFRMFKLEKV